MGSAIAAHFANAGFPVDLLDMAASELTADEQGRGLTLSHPQVRNRIVNRGLESARRNKPPAFFAPECLELVRPGNLEDNVSRLSGADWIIEAVTENLAIKQQVLKRIETVRKPGTIVSSNTSGIPIQELSSGLGEDFRRHWLGTHFFNPPRYMRLLEVIPTAETLPAVIQTVAEIGDQRLGKGIVYAKDTPNFVANRIGTLSLQHTIHAMVEGKFSIDEIDQMTGPAIGRPKSATFELWTLSESTLLSTLPITSIRTHRMMSDENCLNCLPSSTRWSRGAGWEKRVAKVSTREQGRERFSPWTSPLWSMARERKGGSLHWKQPNPLMT